MEEELVLFENDDGGKVPDGLVVDDGAGQVFIQEAFYVEWNVFVLEGFDGFWVNDLGAVVGHFDNFFVVEFADDFGMGEYFWVGVHDAFNIFPDGEGGGIEEVGEDGGGVVAAFAAEGGAFVFCGATDEALGDEHAIVVEQGAHLGFDAFAGVVVVDVGIAVGVVCAEDVAYVDPGVRDFGMVEVGADDGGGEQFADADYLVVIVVKFAYGSVVEKPFYFGEEIEQGFFAAVVLEQFGIDGEVFLFDGIEEGQGLFLFFIIKGVDDLFQFIGGFAHGRDDDDEWLTGVGGEQGGKVLNSFYTVD